VDLLDEVGYFSWSFYQNFFVETPQGNFVWSSPDYCGDNTLRKFDGTHNDWVKTEGIYCSRDKGQHVIRDYCGKDVKVIT
jgi:hypothetical protein